MAVSGSQTEAELEAACWDSGAVYSTDAVATEGGCLSELSDHYLNF